jgi:hypothetical protein
MADIRNHRQQKTIGYILDFIHGYQETAWCNVAKCLNNTEHSLVAFIGGALMKGTSADTPVINRVFDFAFCDWIDSLIISGATLGSYSTKEEYSKNLEIFNKKKSVSMGPCGANIPSVIIENRSGISGLVAHLAKNHGKKRIAFLSGPDSSEEAQERFAAYKEGLKAVSLEFDPMLVYTGNFWYNSGASGVSEFLDVRKVKFDAIMAANDYMAMGASRELVRRGIHIPQDIAVTGYDDVLEAQCENPSLTTVRQPIELQACAVVNYLTQPASRALESLATQLVIRRSCGCQPRDLELASSVADGARQDAQAITAKIQEKVGKFIITSAEEFHRLIESGLVAAKFGNFDAFYSEIESTVYKGVQAGDGTESWQNAVSVMREGFLPYISSQNDCILLENVIGKLRVLIGNLEKNRLLVARSKDSLFSETLSASLKEIATAEDFETLGKILCQRMKEIGFKSFYLALKADIAPGCGSGLDPEQDIILYSAMSDEENFLGSSGPKKYQAKDFLPLAILPNRPFNFVAMPVTFGMDFFGVTVFEPGPQDGTIYPRINDQISATIQSALVISSWKKTEADLQNKTSRVFSIAKPMSQSVLSAAALAKEEARAIESASEAARKTRADINETEKAILRMAQKTGSIKEYIAVIEDISSTISLLGLNAAIEAARAGKAGRGFNVIAGEIRKLAESSTVNVERIGSMLNDISNEAGTSVESAKLSSNAFTILDSELSKVFSALKDISGRLDLLTTSSEDIIKTI